MAVAGQHNAFDIAFHHVALAAAQGADIDHHIDFFRAVPERGQGFGYLRSRERCAERKSSDGADLDHGAAQFLRRHFGPEGINANAGKLVFQSLGADVADFIPGRFRLKDGVIDKTRD